MSKSGKIEARLESERNPFKEFVKKMQDFLHISMDCIVRFPILAWMNAAPLALAEDVLLSPINVVGGYSLLQIGIAAGVVGAGIWGLRALYNKAING